MRLFRPGKNQDTAGVAVEPVYGQYLFVAALQKAEQVLGFSAEPVGNSQRTGCFLHDQDMIVFV